MMRFTASSAAVLLGLIPACAVAQSALPDPAVPGSGYRIPSAGQAQALRPNPGCGATASKLRDGIEFRISRPGNADNTLTTLRSFLEAASAAATAGNDAACDYWLARYNNHR